MTKPFLAFVEDGKIGVGCILEECTEKVTFRITVPVKENEKIRQRIYDICDTHVILALKISLHNE